MSISTILNLGMQGVQAGMNRTAIASSNLNVESDSFEARMVALRQGEIEAKASANVIRAGDAILESLIGIRK